MLNNRLVSLLVKGNTLAATNAKRQSNRWPALLDRASSRFAEQGFHATTIRELATAAAMTPGAIYFHVPTKQALLIAVYEEGVERITDRVDSAVAGETQPWQRLEKAVQLLRETEMSVFHVSWYVGLKPGQLRNLFHENYGCTPKEFRRQSPPA